MKEVEIFRIQIIAIAVSLALIFFIINLIKKRKLKEKYGLLWILASFSILFLSIRRDLLEKTAYFIGIDYPPAALFLAALFFGFLLFLYFSIVISDLSEKTKKLAQEIGFLKFELEKKKSRKRKRKK